MEKGNGGRTELESVAFLFNFICFYVCLCVPEYLYMHHMHALSVEARERVLNPL